ncbi:MAG: hypothetical protein ACJ8FY_26820 [Gemmataceae bacterium]
MKALLTRAYRWARPVSIAGVLLVGIALVTTPAFANLPGSGPLPQGGGAGGPQGTPGGGGGGGGLPKGGPGPGPTAVPELDPGSLLGIATLLTGGVLILTDRFRQRVSG